MDWLRLPLAVLYAYGQMLPRLLAEGSLTHVEEIAIGTATMAKADRRDRLRDLAKVVSSGQQAQKPDEEQKKMMMAAAGIEVEAR